MFRISARTVLELGAELISKDVIAFYELIKNGFDAKSKNGVEVHFRVALRRNAYLALRSSAAKPIPSKPGPTVAHLVAELGRQLDASAEAKTRDAIVERCGEAKTVAAFVTALDTAYREFNTIEVSDSGSGMTSEDLTKNFLVIGTPSRKREVDKALADGDAETPYLGEKGIGRLSAMRLGERLIVTSARADDKKFNVLDLDWKRFSELELMIEDVVVEPVTGGEKPSPKWSGTKLMISDLSEDWTHAKLKALAEYDFARLTDPFLDPKKRPRIALFWNGTRIAIPWMDSDLLEHAHASFSGSYFIDEKDGPVLKATIDVRDLKTFVHPPISEGVEIRGIDLQGLLIGEHGDLPLNAMTSVGPFEFEVYWFNRKYLSNVAPTADEKSVRDLHKRWAGILLFRDTFRIFPYGDDDDDWLGLDRHAMARSGYTLNKQQFVGRVNISRTKNPNLLDQTNREGLRRTPEERILVGALGFLIQDSLLGLIREVERRYRNEPIDLADAKTRVKELEKRAKSAIARMRKVVPDDHVGTVDEIEETLREFHELVAAAQARIQEVEKDGKQMLEIAGVGLMVEVVAHELARSSENALKALDGLRGTALPADVRARLDTLRDEMKTVSKRLRILDPLSVAGRQRTESFDLRELIEELRDGHAAQFRRQNVAFEITGSKGPLHVRTVKGMVAQVLENLISNSLYWMQLRADREASYQPRITVRLDTNPATIAFSDNGPGIAPENVDKVFRAFWSLKENAKRRGLGLYIARENAAHMGATLTLSGEEGAKSRQLNTFVLELPAEASKK